MRRPLNRLPATQLARMIAAHDVTCEAVTHSFIDAIHESEPEVRAFAWFDADRAIATAREFDRLEWRGTLHGLPAAIKDNFDTADIPSHYGSTISWDMCRRPMPPAWRRCAPLGPSCLERR